jgi:hypothetical protein
MPSSTTVYLLVFLLSSTKFYVKVPKPALVHACCPPPPGMYIISTNRRHQQPIDNDPIIGTAIDTMMNAVHHRSTMMYLCVTNVWQVSIRSWRICILFDSLQASISHLALFIPHSSRVLLASPLNSCSTILRTFEYRPIQKLLLSCADGLCSFLPTILLPSSPFISPIVNFRFLSYSLVIHSKTRRAWLTKTTTQKP